MIPLRAATLAGDPELEAALAGAIASDDRFDLVLRCVDRAELLGTVRGGAVDVVLLAGLPHWVDRQSIDEARDRGVALVVVGKDPDERERIARHGLRWVPVPDPAAIFQVLDSAPPPSPPVERDPTGRLVAVWGPKGAPGRTSMALELATQIARHDAATLLVDADPYGGDLLQLTGIVEELPTVVWAARMAAKDELGDSSFTSELRRIGPRGPVLLPGLPRPELWPDVSDYGWRRLLEAARAQFDYTLCDIGFCFEPDPSPYPEAGEGRNRIARTALVQADRIVAVCRADPVGVKQFAWAIEALRGLVDLDKVIVVLNRARRSTLREVRALVKRHTNKVPAASVPERVAEWHKAVDAGVAVHELKGTAVVADALAPVVERLGVAVPATGFLSRLVARR